MIVSTVVICDNSKPLDMQRCLTYVLRTAPADTSIVVASHRSIQMSAKTARRVRMHRTQGASSVSAVAHDLVSGDDLTVVLGADCLLRQGWWAGVQLAAVRHPETVTDLGGEGTQVLVFPRGVRPLLATQASSEPVRVSASLIVKDEELVLADCLAAIAPFVDEIVVYDTGSSDNTVEIARAAGAVVVQGWWNDHFGEARERALEHCTGDWVVHVDADEVAQGDPAAFRALLQAETMDLLRVPILLTTWSGASDGSEVRPFRVFRRTVCRWVGALHEYLDARDPGRPLRSSGAQVPMRLVHSGYHQATVAEKDKVQRNLDIARSSVEQLVDGSPGADLAWSHYGRALASAGRAQEAVEAFAHVLEEGTNSTGILQAGRVALPCLLALGMHEDYQRWMDLMARHRESSANLALHRARLAASTGDLEGARATVLSIEPDLDLWGVRFDEQAASSLLVDLAAAAGEHNEAADRLLALATSHPDSVDLGRLLDVVEAAGLRIGEVAGSVSDAFVDKSLRDAATLPAARALPWLESLLERDRQAVGPLVAGCVVASRSTLVDLVTWAAHARSRDFTQLCPLRSAAHDHSRSTADRALLWAVMGSTWGDDDAFLEFEALLVDLAADARGDLAHRLAAVAPSFAAFVR